MRLICWGYVGRGPFGYKGWMTPKKFFIELGHFNKKIEVNRFIGNFQTLANLLELLIIRTWKLEPLAIHGGNIVHRFRKTSYSGLSLLVLTFIHQEGSNFGNFLLPEPIIRIEMRLEKGPSWTWKRVPMRRPFHHGNAVWVAVFQSFGNLVHEYYSAPERYVPWGFQKCNTQLFKWASWKPICSICTGIWKIVERSIRSNTKLVWVEVLPIRFWKSQILEVFSPRKSSYNALLALWQYLWLLHLSESKSIWERSSDALKYPKFLRP